VAPSLFETMPANTWAKGVRDRRGATIVEYALLLVLVLVIAAGIFRVIGKDARKSGDMTRAQFT
jgi:hypothetical protein